MASTYYQLYSIHGCGYRSVSCLYCMCYSKVDCLYSCTVWDSALTHSFIECAGKIACYPQPRQSAETRVQREQSGAGSIWDPDVIGSRGSYTCSIKFMCMTTCVEHNVNVRSLSRRALPSPSYV